MALMLTLPALAGPGVDDVLAAPVKRSYVWFGEMVTYDEKSSTVTVKAPYREHINRYVVGFRPGDRLLLIWATPRPGETDVVTYLGRHEANADVRHGYVLPVEFVSADTTARELTFSVAVPSKALKALKAIPSGGWMKVTTPFDQPNATAAITAVEASGEPPTQPAQGSASRQLTTTDKEDQSC
jgi:hypothetical protein